MDRLVWAATDTFAIGDWHLGVRTNADDAGATVRRLLAAHHVPGGDAPPNFSLSLSADAGGRSRDLNLLFRSGQMTVRTRNRARALAGLLNVLHAFTPLDPSLLRVRGSVVVSLDGDAFLLPDHVINWLKQLQPRFSRLGLRLADVPYASLDPATGDVVVPEPAVAYDAAVLAEHESTRQGGSELAWVRPGRYRLRAWGWGSGPDMPGRTSAALAVAANLALADLQPRGVAGTLEAMRDILTTATPYGLWYGSVDALVEQVATMAVTA